MLKFIRKYSTKIRLQSALKDAEKSIGYSTSFLNLRFILTDEVANLASKFNNLLGTNHPILKTAKEALTGSRLPMGLVVLLLSKAAGFSTKVANVEKDEFAGILHTQRMVAEVIEIIAMGMSFHSSMSDHKNEDMLQGNKISLLLGDYLIAKSYQVLSEIKNSDVEYVISTGFKDFSEYEFLGLRDKNNNPIPYEDYTEIQDDLTINDILLTSINPKNFLKKPKSEWIIRNYLSGASLLSKGCLSALILGGNVELQKHAYLFGLNLYLAFKASSDLKSLENYEDFNPVCAPFLFELCKKSRRNFNNDVKGLKSELCESEGYLKTVRMKEEFKKEGFRCLEVFPDGAAKNHLGDILVSV